MKRVCSKCGKRRDEERFTGPRGRTCDLCRRTTTRTSARAHHLQVTYNITQDEYDLLARDGCNICVGKRPYNLPVDHDHSLAVVFGVRASVRGALCKRCNKLLRDVGDNPELLIAAADYLRNPPAKKVLFP